MNSTPALWLECHKAMTQQANGWLLANIGPSVSVCGYSFCDGSGVETCSAAYIHDLILLATNKSLWW